MENQVLVRMYVHFWQVFGFASSEKGTFAYQYQIQYRNIPVL